MCFLITLHCIKYNISNMGLDVNKLWYKMTRNKSLVSIDKKNEWEFSHQWIKNNIIFYVKQRVNTQVTNNFVRYKIK
jgi:hypothetical protein